MSRSIKLPAIARHWLSVDRRQQPSIHRSVRSFVVLSFLSIACNKPSVRPLLSIPYMDSNCLSSVVHCAIDSLLSKTSVYSGSTAGSPDVGSVGSEAQRQDRPASSRPPRGKWTSTVKNVCITAWRSWTSTTAPRPHHSIRRDADMRRRAAQAKFSSAAAH